VETAAIIIALAKVEPRVRAARQGVILPPMAHPLPGAAVEIPTGGVEDLEVQVGRMGVVRLAPVIIMATHMEAAVEAAVPGILGAEVDHGHIMMVPAAGGEVLLIRAVRARATYPEVVYMPGIKPIPTTPAPQVREVHQDGNTVMEAVAIPDGS
jgi:hypothetical protein